VDQIYNLACPASPIHYQHDPVQTTKTSGMVRSTCWDLRNACGQEFSRRPRQKSMAIRTSTLKPRTVGATSIQLVRAPATMKANAVWKHCSLTIGGSIDWKSKLPGSSIPMARACTRTMAGWYPISSFATPLQHDQAPRLDRKQATSTRGVRARIRSVAGCATPTGSGGHAGATANLKLTFHLDHSAGADQSLHSFAQLRQNRQNQLLFEVPECQFHDAALGAGVS